jgi:hypothetical protein
MTTIPLKFLSQQEVKDVLAVGRTHPLFSSYSTLADIFMFIICNEVDIHDNLPALKPYEVPLDPAKAQCSIPFCDGAGPLLPCCPNHHLLHATCIADCVSKAKDLVCPLCRNDYVKHAIQNCISCMLLRRLTPFGVIEMETIAETHFIDEDTEMILSVE